MKESLWHERDKIKVICKTELLGRKTMKEVGEHFEKDYNTILREIPNILYL